MKKSVPKPAREIIAFPTPAVWEKWLHKNHTKTEGIWVRFYKKVSGVLSITYLEALHGALAYGWIDGQSDSHDTDSWIQKFTPRRAKSMWSKRNRNFIEQLRKTGKLQPAGLKQVEAAKADGRWEKAYDSPSTMTTPEDFLEKLKKNKKAFAFFETLNKANKYAITWRLQTAKKPETREKRMKLFLEMMRDGKKFH